MPMALITASNTRLIDSTSQWLEKSASDAVVAASAIVSVAAKVTAAREGPSRLRWGSEPYSIAAAIVAAVSASAS